MISLKRTLLCFTCVAALSGCSHHALFDNDVVVEAPKVGQTTKSARLLASLPPPASPIAVTVYAFDDQTGQLKPNNNFAEYSRAVTQGGLSVLNKALLSAGDGRWFTVVERGGLKNLLQERQIIDAMRQQYTLPDGTALEPLPPMLYAGVLIEGGIVGYDSDLVTGGIGAKYLGVGGDVKHQRDIVTVDLRAVNVSNGQVLLSVTAEKTIYSSALQGSIFKYVGFDRLLEFETGVTMNEPPQLAVRQAIDVAVYSLIMEGVRKGLWGFEDEKLGKRVMAHYLSLLNGNAPVIGSNERKRLTENQIPPNAAPKNGDVAQKLDKVIQEGESSPSRATPGSTLPTSPPTPLPARRRQ